MSSLTAEMQSPPIEDFRRQNHRVTDTFLTLLLANTYHLLQHYYGDLGKVSPNFPAALFSVDARFAQKIERPQKGIK